MKQTLKAILIAGTALVTAQGVAHAENGATTSGSQNYELAYADPAPETGPEGIFDLFSFEEDLHELNDAWLGMPVKDRDGQLVGFVADAYLDDDGEVTELLVELDASSRDYSVYVDASTTILTDDEVAVNLTGSEIAALEREEKTLLSRR